MQKHMLSFLRSPVGYIAKLLATVGTKLPTVIETALFGQWLCTACEVFCLQDGIQDDCLF